MLLLVCVRKALSFDRRLFARLRLEKNLCPWTFLEIERGALYTKSQTLLIVMERPQILKNLCPLVFTGDLNEIRRKVPNDVHDGHRFWTQVMCPNKCLFPCFVNCYS